MSISDIEIAPLMESIDLGLAMCKNYKIRWKRPLDTNFVFAVPEQEIIVDIPGTEHPCNVCWEWSTTEGMLNNIELTYAGDRSWHRVRISNDSCIECQGKGYTFHKLRMILDGLIKDKNSVYLVLERKPFDRTPSEEMLQNNDQFMGYVWGV